MIRTVRSSLPSFKTLEFKPGLNILLADVAEKSTGRHTRNSAGKTSLVEIIHFLLGSDVKKGSLFKHESLDRVSFSMELRIGDRWVWATRSGAADNRVYLSADDAEALKLPLDYDWPDEQGYVSVEAWKALLGEQWFDLPLERDGTDFEGKGAPTFRQLIGYFARRRKDGGLDSIEKSSRDQQPGSWQVALSYLLGLNWGIAREFQFMRDRKRSADALRKAIGEGEFGHLFGTAAEIRPELARTEEKLRGLRLQTESFEVHDSYRDLAARASALKDRMNELTFDLAEAESAVEYMRKSLNQERPPAYSDVEQLYKAAGIELPEVALRRFDDVKAFQESVTANRKGYLQAQIDETEARRNDTANELQEAGAERTSILKALDGKGAFEDLIRLREQVGELASRAETLRSKLQHVAALENSQAQLKAEGAELQLRLQQNYEEDEDAIKRATVLVDQAITQLYDDRTGNLIVEASRSGPKFRIDIEGGGNKGGIDMMKIFCFDVALLQIAAERFRPGPRLLIHDSHLFDGVDSRQVAQALVHGNFIATEVGGQYIVALNSDELHNAVSESDAPLADFVNPMKLTDDEDGGLFGFRFDLETTKKV